MVAMVIAFGLGGMHRPLRVKYHFWTTTKNSILQ